MNITEIQRLDVPTLASHNIHFDSELGELEAGAESPSLQTNSRASSPSVQSVDSAADDTNLSNFSLFVAPTDSQLAIEATSRVLALSSPVHQIGEETSRSSTHSQSSNGDLREALVLLARGKEEAEATVLELQQKLEERELRCMELERELVIAQTEVQQVRESHIQQRQSLERCAYLCRCTLSSCCWLYFVNFCMLLHHFYFPWHTPCSLSLSLFPSTILLHVCLDCFLMFYFIRENDLLREQLKRHVALVQSHQHQQHSSTADQENMENRAHKSDLQEKLTAVSAELECTESVV